MMLTILLGAPENKSEKQVKLILTAKLRTLQGKPNKRSMFVLVGDVQIQRVWPTKKLIDVEMFMRNMRNIRNCVQISFVYRIFPCWSCQWACRESHDMKRLASNRSPQKIGLHCFTHHGIITKKSASFAQATWTERPVWRSEKFEPREIKLILLGGSPQLQVPKTPLQLDCPYLCWDILNQFISEPRISRNHTWTACQNTGGWKMSVHSKNGRLSGPSDFIWVFSLFFQY